MNIRIIFFFALLFAFVNFVNAQTFTWKGSSTDASLDNNWDEQTNWSTGDGSDGDDGYPNSTSHTVIIPDVTNDPVINIAGAVFLFTGSKVIIYLLIPHSFKFFLILLRYFKFVLIIG